MMLHFGLKLAAILLVILDASIESIAAFTGQSIDNEFLGMAATEGDVDFTFQYKDDAIEVIALVVNQVVLWIEEFLHFVCQFCDDLLIGLRKNWRLI